jgi:hypothetical protein
MRYFGMVQWLVLRGAANGKDGHVDPAAIRKQVPTEVFPFLAQLLVDTLNHRAAFGLVLLASLLDGSVNPARMSPLRKLRGQALALSLVADFLGVVRGRGLRNLREAVEALKQQQEEEAGGGEMSLAFQELGDRSDTFDY